MASAACDGGSRTITPRGQDRGGWASVTVILIFILRAEAGGSSSYFPAPSAGTLLPGWAIRGFPSAHPIWDAQTPSRVPDSGCVSLSFLLGETLLLPTRPKLLF